MLVMDSATLQELVARKVKKLFDLSRELEILYPPIYFYISNLCAEKIPKEKRESRRSGTISKEKLTMVKKIKTLSLLFVPLRQSI